MVFCVQSAFGQTYAYTYQGTLTPTQLEQFELECAQLPHVLSCKIRHKDEKGQGEIIVVVEQTERADQDQPFSTADLKAFIQANGLEPMTCIEIKPTR